MVTFILIQFAVEDQLGDFVRILLNYNIIYLLQATLIGWNQ
jgi:hypothetical protein